MYFTTPNNKLNYKTVTSEFKMTKSYVALGNKKNLFRKSWSYLKYLMLDCLIEGEFLHSRRLRAL